MDDAVVPRTSGALSVLHCLLPLLPMPARSLVEPLAIATATATAAATATGVVALARGDTRGAPGVTKSLARLGRTVGGSMLTGVAVASATGALTGLALYAAYAQVRDR